MKVLYVEWIDAIADNGWSKMDDCEDVSHCKTIGYLIKETEEGICLASTISEKECNARITIPKQWIKRKKWVALDGKKTKKSR